MGEGVTCIQATEPAQLRDAEAGGPGRWSL